MDTPVTAGDIMVTKLITLHPGMDLFASIDVLLKHKISGAAVVDENRHYLGIFSERCCMDVVVDAAYEQVPFFSIDPYIDRDAATITESTDLFTIAHIFRENHCRRLPVLRENTLVGQISRRDLLKAVHKMIGPKTSYDSELLYLSSLHERNEQTIV